MSEQYFSAVPGSAHDRKTLRFSFLGRDYVFDTDAGVFSKDGLDEGTALLLATLLPELKGDVLDLGCGWGPVGTIAAAMRPGIRMSMTDINLRAVELARHNLAQNGVKAQVYCGNGLEQVKGDFDWILLNPPIRAGKQTVYALFEQSAARLKPGGTLAIVIRKQQGAQSAREYLGQLFTDISMPARKKGYHIYVCRRAENEV